jgi:hypothetical protein
MAAKQFWLRKDHESLHLGATLCITCFESNSIDFSQSTASRIKPNETRIRQFWIGSKIESGGPYSIFYSREKYRAKLALFDELIALNKYQHWKLLHVIELWLSEIEMHQYTQIIKNASRKTTNRGMSFILGKDIEQNTFFLMN